MKKTLNDYLKLPYRMEFVRDGTEGGYVVSLSLIHIQMCIRDRNNPIQRRLCTPPRERPKNSGGLFPEKNIMFTEALTSYREATQKIYMEYPPEGMISEDIRCMTGDDRFV